MNSKTFYQKKKEIAENFFLVGIHFRVKAEENFKYLNYRIIKTILNFILII